MSTTDIVGRMLMCRWALGALNAGCAWRMHAAPPGMVGLPACSVLCQGRCAVLQAELPAPAVCGPPHWCCHGTAVVAPASLQLVHLFSCSRDNARFSAEDKERLTLEFSLGNGDTGALRCATIHCAALRYNSLRCAAL